MRHSQILIGILLLVIPLSLCAQNQRIVKGYVYDANGRPLPGATVSPVGSNTLYQLHESDGSFSISVSFAYNQLTASCSGYVPVTKEIDGSYLLFYLQVDVEAERARIAAEERARREEEARIRAEEDAKIRAQKEEEARIKAEETAKIRAEQERLAAEAKAKRDAEKSRKKALRQEKDSTYNVKFKNHGLAHSVRASYAYQLAECRTAYFYSGFREYGSLHPLQLDYALSYKINRIFSVGAGVGIMFNSRSVFIVGDEFVCSGFKEHRIDVPVFAVVSAYFGRWKVRPAVSVFGGYYPLSRVTLVEGLLGAEYRLARKLSLEVGVFVKTTPYPYFDMENETGGYTMAISPGAAVRFNF